MFFNYNNNNNKKTLLGSKVLMDAEASLAPGKRVCWEGVGSLGQGKLKGTAVWMDPEQEKKAGDRTSSGRFLNSANPPRSPFFVLSLVP